MNFNEKKYKYIFYGFDFVIFWDFLDFKDTYVLEGRSYYLPLIVY